MSEIEDIFASKGKAKAIPTQNYPSSSKITSKAEKKRKRKKKSAVTSKIQYTEPVVPSKKRQHPETVVDTSHAPPKRQKKEKQKQMEATENSRESLSAFQDSRSTSGKKRTEEGWLVYREDELGINDTGGDTPLCPFDCACCF